MCEAVTKAAAVLTAREQHTAAARKTSELAALKKEKSSVQLIYNPKGEREIRGKARLEAFKKGGLEKALARKMLVTLELQGATLSIGKQPFRHLKCVRPAEVQKSDMDSSSFLQDIMGITYDSDDDADDSDDHGAEDTN